MGPAPGCGKDVEGSDEPAGPVGAITAWPITASSCTVWAWAYWEPLVASIQCSPRVRYGEEACSRADALAASRACLKLIVELVRGGAAFRRRRP